MRSFDLKQSSSPLTRIVASERRSSSSVNRRVVVTPSVLIKSDTCGADRRRDPTPKHRIKTHNPGSFRTNLVWSLTLPSSGRCAAVYFWRLPCGGCSRPLCTGHRRSSPHRGVWLCVRLLFYRLDMTARWTLVGDQFEHRTHSRHAANGRWALAQTGAVLGQVIKLG